MENAIVMGNNNIGRGRKNLTTEERRAIYELMLKHSEGGVIKRGYLSVVAAKFSVSVRTVLRIWEQATNYYPSLFVNVSSNMRGHVGRKRIQIDRTKVSEVPLRQRINIRTMASALEVPKSTLHRRIKEGFLRPHSNALKPALTDENKIARLQFCLSMLENRILNEPPLFNDMFNVVHIDEKWFYMTKESEKYYLLPEEEDPLRTCKSKKHITKIMFLAAVARPRFDHSRNQEFSGKIGIFPFIIKEPAKRKSKNRPAGTLETKPILSITKEVVRECLIQQVLPAIRSKWPSHGPIFIQQDNARPHIKSDDEEFTRAASTDGFDIRLYCQPPNSPDLNVLDLGFFQAIQSLQYQEAPKMIDDLVQAVNNAFERLSSKSLNFVFLTLRNCMIETMKDLGGNKYKVPHMGKDRLEREGALPVQLQLEEGLLEKVLNHLQQ